MASWKTHHVHYRIYKKLHLQIPSKNGGQIIEMPSKTEDTVDASEFSRGESPIIIVYHVF